MPPVKRSTPPSPIEIFYSYSHKDEELRNDLEKHLSSLKRSGAITGWHDRKITAGTEWKGKIDQHLNAAKVILLLISADFLASDYCYDLETKRALWRHARGYCRVIPVILRACDWHIVPLSKLQALPTDGKPVTSWRNKDEAFTNIAKGIRAAIKEVTSASSNHKTPLRKTPTNTIKKKLGEQKQSGATTAVAASTSPTLSASGKKTPTPSTKNPVGSHLVASPSLRSSKPGMKKSIPTIKTVKTLPGETVALYVEGAFRNRPNTNVGTGISWLQVAWRSLRVDVEIKPTLFVDRDFIHGVQHLAHTGKPSLFSFGASNEDSHTMAHLQITQKQIARDGRGGQDLIELTIYANGVLSVALNVTNVKGRDIGDWSPTSHINPDDVQARLEQAWGFAARWWKRQFGAKPSNDEALLYNVGLFDPQHYNFGRPQQRGRTRIISFSMRTRPSLIMVHDVPKLIERSVLLKPGLEIADIIKMLQLRFDEVDNQR